MQAKSKEPKPAQKPQETEVKDGFKRSRVSNLFLRANGSYYGRMMFMGTVHKASFGKDSLQEAQSALAIWRGRITGDIHHNDPDTKETVGQLIEAFKAKFAAEQHSAAHRLFVANRFKFLAKTWPALAASKISSPEAHHESVKDWVSRLLKEGYAHATVRGTLIYLSKCFEQCPAVQNPCDGIKVMAPRFDPHSKKRQLSEQDFDRVLAEMRRLGANARRAGDLAELLAATGARVGEVVGRPPLPGLRWCDVAWTRRQVSMVTLKGRVAKGTVGQRRVVPFHRRLEALLVRLKEHAGNRELVSLCKVTALRSLHGACRRLHARGELGTDRLTQHDLRHLFTTWCLDHGLTIHSVAGLLGHKDGGALLLRTYGHLRNAHLHAEVAKLNDALELKRPAAPKKQPRHDSETAVAYEPQLPEQQEEIAAHDKASHKAPKRKHGRPPGAEVGHRNAENEVKAKRSRPAKRRKQPH